MKFTPIVLGTALVITSLLGCSKTEEAKAPPAAAAKVEAKKVEPKFDRAALGIFKSLPKHMTADGKAPDANKVALGRTLYYDTRLSKNHDISCNSCHLLDKFGVDNQPTSPGHKAQRGGRNSPTVYNAAGHIAQFWDGRAADVEAQASGPITNPVEMAMPDEASVMKVLTSIPGYGPMFKAAFPGDKSPITVANAANAIGAFERNLVTPGRWDKFLGGDDSALTAAEKEGLQVFISSGCQSCHNGPYMGGALYQKLGMIKPWPALTDNGRMEATGKEADKYYFKVPSLRNISKTGPYLHNGSIGQLNVMVAMMADHQLGKVLQTKEVEAIVTFLGALDGTMDAEYIKAPKMPESGPNTPKADPS